MTNKKTYTLLLDIQPPIPILTCSQVLPNRLQCWRGADYLVEETLPPPAKTETKPAPEGEKKEAAPPPEKKAEKTEAPPETRKYQLCSLHAVIMQRADALADQEEASGKEQPPAGEKGSIHSKMMQMEQTRSTTSMPRGEARG